MTALQCNAAPDGVLEFLGLESCAECIAGCGCIMRTYGNFVCGAVSIAIVVVAILYVALNTLDVLFTAILMLFHFHFLFPLAVLCKRLSSFAAFSLSARMQIYSF